MHNYKNKEEREISDAFEIMVWRAEQCVLREQGNAERQNEIPMAQRDKINVCLPSNSTTKSAVVPTR